MKFDLKKYFKLLIIFILNIISLILKPIKKFEKFCSKFIFYRYIKFFLLSDNIFLVKELNNIKFLINSEDQVNSRKIYVNNYFPQFSESAAAINFLSEYENYKITKFIDLGAHYGNLSIPLMKKFNFKKCYAIEPILENFNILKFNILLNNLEKEIIPINSFISNETKNLEINTFSNNSAASLEMNDLTVKDKELYKKLNNLKPSKFETVASNTLGNVVLDDLDQSYMLWIYAQGSELKILQGAENKLKKQPALVIAYAPNINSDFTEESESKIYKILKKIGYKSVVNLSRKNLVKSHIDNEFFLELNKKLKSNSGTNFLLFL